MKLLESLLSKDYILNKISEEQIFEHYLGFPVQDGFVKNPLREDKTPGCKFYYRDNKLIFNDFAWRQFDCFDYVMQKYSLTYKEAIKRVADDLIWHNPQGVTYKVSEFKKTQKEKEFKIKIKPFTREELAFWNIGGLNVTELELNQGGIYSVDILWEDGYSIENLKMVFAYVEDGRVRQVYFPQNKKEGKRRFRNQKGFIVGGWNQLRTDVSYVVCTKSFKDMFILKKFGINCIYIVNEKILLNEGFMNTLESMYDFVGFLLDNDYTGKRQLIHYKQTYPNITPMLFDCSEGKDTYDVVKQFGADYFMDLIESVKKRFL